ncbi:bifunctional metallophosphatase/5'-nucleotidase [Altericroceibacterium xinjiangense]|uniref:bifunctional metallophosphatase/5'-nucleotidase n=1 Tax=Altericroceibacterium xinjiangense TaxID=762261 RepID=UPI000F7DC525|nr:bifunctional metallophosphatase/5'-nucleotidase [Altericroceibacterium xinjiangense]
MKFPLFCTAALLALAGCATPLARLEPVPPPPIEVQILAINDFHGNLEAPGISVEADAGDGTRVQVPAGGVAVLAGAAAALRAGARYSMTVSAGDMIGASPLSSALFLDEPTVQAMELVGVEYNAVGNHEFDKGADELVRMQQGGCTVHTPRQPCRLEPFDGAAFAFLAANVQTESGETLFPGWAIKDFGPVQVGLIGMTLKDTATLVTPGGVEGLTFGDEAATANALVPRLKAAGADAVVLLIHQGGRMETDSDPSCPGLTGDILPILDKLDPEIDLVVSGHTHQAYVCKLARKGGGPPLLLTSAGRYGTRISDIRLAFQPDGTLIAADADNVIVREASSAVVPLLPAFAPDAATAALVQRYVSASRTEAARVVGTLSGPVTRQPNAAGEDLAGLLIADAHLAAGRAKGAEIAFFNQGGARTGLTPGENGAITYGQIFAMQPFGNTVTVLTLTGAQLKALLEQQFASGSNTTQEPTMLFPSEGFSFAYDLSRPAGERVVEMRLNGGPVTPGRRYRIAVNSFLASGGDNFTVLKQATDRVDAGLDLEALEGLLKPGAAVPQPGRIRRLGNN